MPQARPSTELPFVSVLVAVYNHAPYICECLDSILAAGYPNLELIITNDASPDDSDTQIRRWLAAHPELQVTYLLNPENLGLTRSLNRAIKLAQHDFLCMFAGDDVMLPGSVTSRVRYLQAHPHKLAVFADSHVIDETGQLTHSSGIEDLCPDIGMRKVNLQHDRLLLYSVVFNFMVPGPVFLCHKALFDSVGFYDETLLVEDWDMYLRAAAAGKLGFLDAYVANYRVQRSSMMRQHSRTNFLLPSLSATIKKNARRSKGLVRARLLALQAALAYDAAPSGYTKAWLWAVHKVLLATTNLGYRLGRQVIGTSAPRIKGSA